MGKRWNMQATIGWLACLCVLAAAFLSAESCLAQPADKSEDSSLAQKPDSDDDIASIGMPIDSGWVVLDGEIVEGPYVISQQKNEISLNGQCVITLVQGSGRGREGPRRGDGGAERHADGQLSDQERQRHRRNSFAAARFERHLIGGGLIVIVTDAGSAMIGRNSIPNFLDAIASDIPLADKVQALNGMVNRPAHSAIWLQTIDRFRSNTRLDQIAVQIRAEKEQRIRERDARLADVGWFDWLMPMTAIGGVLAGLGVLMQIYRKGLKDPGSYRVWRHVDTTGQRSKVVLMLIGLLVLLNGLDLAFTIIAQQTGEFAELSPIGDRLITEPILLGLYKIAAVALGAGLLLYLRQRRAAEVAAWWMCALYVLVLVRWVAVNTVIMA